MIALTLLTTLLLPAITLAAPTDKAARWSFPSVPLTFNGAAGTSYSLVVLANGASVNINNPLSVTSISMYGRASFTCAAYGIDGSKTYLVANQQNVPVGPPQTQISVSCAAPPEGS